MREGHLREKIEQANSKVVEKVKKIEAKKHQVDNLAEMMTVAMDGWMEGFL